VECCGCQDCGNVADSCPQATGEEEEEEDTTPITTRHDCSTDHGHILLWGCAKKKFLNFIPKTAISRPSSKDVSSGAPDFSDPNVAATEAKASVNR